MCRIGDAVRMAVATASAASEHPPGSDVAIRSKIQKSSPILPISPRGKPMCMRWHLRNAQSSSTQTWKRNLSATTLSVAQLASHSHNLNGGAFIGNGSGGDYSGQVQWASSGFRAFNTTANTGSNWSHSHGISNPAHSHTAQSTSIKLMPPAKALHYIMRIA